MLSKRTLTVFFFSTFFLPEISHAQIFQMGLKGGLSLPNLSSRAGGSDVSRGYKTITGPDIALVADYKIQSKFSIETGIEWSTQGGQKSGVQTIPASSDLAQYFPPGSNIQYLYANFSSTVRLQYLMLPVLLKYTMDISSSDHWKLYIGGGIFGGLLMTSKASAYGSGKVYYDREETRPVAPYMVNFDSTGDIKNQLHSGNFGLEGNLGLLYQFNSTALFAEVGGNYGFIDLQKDCQNGINHMGALIFRIGVFISLRRNV